MKKHWQATAKVQNEQMHELRMNADVRGFLAKHALVVGIYAVLTVFMTSPFVWIGNLRGSVLFDGDAGHVMWAISWVNHALLTQPQNLFAANIFYPSAGSLSFNDHTFGIAVLVHPWFWFSQAPFVPYNLLFLFSYFVSAIGMYLLCLNYTQSRPAAFIGGLIFGFCFFRAHHFGHLTLICNQWFPFVILLFHKLRERFRWGLALLWVLLFTLQCLTNWYNAAFVIIILAWVMCADFLQHRWSLKTAKQFTACVLIAAVLIFKFYVPYSRIPKPADYSENKAFAADLGSYFQAPWNTLLGQYLGNTKRWIWEERSTFVGYIPFALALAGILVWWRNRWARTYFLLAIVAFILSLGPESLDFPGLKLPAPLVYAIFPPLAQLRATARFSIITMFCLSILAAMACARIPAMRWLIVPIACLILLEYFPVRLEWDPKTAAAFRSRPVDLWLNEHNVTQSGPPFWRRPKQRDRKVVIELPDYTATPQWYYQSLYVLYSTQHWMNLVNGYARFYPPDYLSRFQTYSKFPSEESIRAMQSTGINYVVVHGNQYDDRRNKELDTCPLLVARFDNDRIYEIK
jgi:hypothetical protein